MISILFIHQSAELYGSDKTLLLLIKNLDKSKFKIVVILPNEGPLKIELEQIGIKVVLAPVLKLYRDIFKLKNAYHFLNEIRTSIKILDNLNKEYQFNLIYSNTLAVLLGAIYARKRKIKHLWHVHEIIVHPKLIASIFPKLLNNFADIIICNSKATLENLVKREKNISNKSKVIHNGLDHLMTVSKISKRQLFFHEDDIIITLIGRISRLKGHKWLLETYKNRLLDFKNVKLLFVGSPVLGQEHYLYDLEEFIKDNNLAENVQILPFTKDLEAVWSATDIAIMPSTEAESFGLVALEAMLHKKPVIASNLGGLKEIVVNNSSGFLVDVNSEIDLQKAITSLVDNKDLRIKMGNTGFDRAISHFSLKSYVEKFEKTFEELV
jgi:glycosyltransferase involved in cell wall biosynthesis